MPQLGIASGNVSFKTPELQHSSGNLYTSTMTETQVTRTGRTPLGPMAESDTPFLPKGEIVALKDSLTFDGQGFQIQLDVDTLSGLLRPFNGRARQVIAALLHGYSQRMAAAAAGLSVDSVQRWGKRHPEFAQAMAEAKDWGFSRTFEAELHRRALAGADDKGSMRALELVTKARAPEYRDKTQQSIEVLHRADSAIGGMIAGWSDQAPTDSSSS